MGKRPMFKKEICVAAEIRFIREKSLLNHSIKLEKYVIKKCLFGIKWNTVAKLPKSRDLWLLEA